MENIVTSQSFASISDFFNYLAPWNNQEELRGFIFRGHSHESYELIPSALRKSHIPELWRYYQFGNPDIDYKLVDQLHHQIGYEFQLLRNFYKLADRQGLEVPKSNTLRKTLAQTWDMNLNLSNSQTIWLPEDLYETAALAQHYGIPTRLLDWSYDPYVALYFAIKGSLDSKEKKENLAVWALNKDEIAFLKPTTHRISIDFITPHYSSNPNINSQKGLFTLCPIKVLSNHEAAKLLMDKNLVQVVERKPLDQVILDEAKSNQTLLKKFILPYQEAKKGLKILEKMGYGTSRIYPGYHGVAKQILESDEHGF